MHFLRVFAVIWLVLGAQPLNSRDNPEFLKDFDFLYREIAENYVNLEYKENRFGFKWDILYNRYRSSIQQAKTEKDFFLIASEFVSQLKDGHSQFLITSRDVRNQILYHYDYVEYPFDVRLIEDKAIIVRCLPEFDINGMEILSINGVDFLKICRSLIKHYYLAGSDHSSIRKLIRYRFFYNHFDLFHDRFPDELIYRLRGRDGQVKSLVIDAHKKYPEGPYATSADINFGFYENQTLPQARILGNRIGYILIPTFDGPIKTIVQAFHDIVLDFKRKGVRAVILDIRYNPGGNESFREILGYLTQKSLYINNYRYRLTDRFAELFPSRLAHEEKKGRKRDLLPEEGYSSWYSWGITPKSEAFLTTVPLAVLSNELSFSSADSFANACLSFNLAKVIGNRVPLTGHGLAKAVPLPSGKYAVRYSFHESRDVDFAHMENVVKTPDVVVEQTLADFFQGTDTQLEAAIAYLQKAMAQAEK